jgi:hypothetical protein
MKRVESRGGALPALNNPPLQALITLIDPAASLPPANAQPEVVRFITRVNSASYFAVFAVAIGLAKVYWKERTRHKIAIETGNERQSELQYNQTVQLPDHLYFRLQGARRRERRISGDLFDLKLYGDIDSKEVTGTPEEKLKALKALKYQANIDFGVAAYTANPQAFIKDLRGWLWKILANPEIELRKRL